MKHFIYSLLLVLAFVGVANGQKVSEVDFDVIKANTTDANSAFYFPQLLKRFQAGDTTLTDADYSHLYYGQVFTEMYSPYSSGDADFLKHYNKEEYQQAIPEGQKVLSQHPLNLKIMFKMLVCYATLGDKATAKAYASRYFPLVRVILASGDGKSIETAYVVAAVADEYQVLGDLELRSAGKQSLVGQTDVLTVRAQKASSEETSKIYFNVSQPLTYLRNSFRKK